MTKSTSSSGARKTLTICGIAHFLHDGLHDALLPLLPIWAQMFGLSLAQVGILKAVYSGTIALFQIPAGVLAERYGERWLLAGGTIIAGIGYMFLGAAGGFAGLAIVLAVVGLGSGVQHPLSSTLVARAYPTDGRRRALGIYNFSGDLGKMALPASVAVIAGAVGWQTGVLVAGILGAVAGVVIFAVLRRLGAGAAAQPEHSMPTGNDSAKGSWGVRNVPAFVTLSAVNVIDTAVIYGFLTFLPFLLLEKGELVENLGLALALTFGGGAVGKLLCGVLAERIGIVRTAIITIIAKGVCILALLWLPLWGALALLPVLGAALNGTSSVLYATVAEFVDPNRHSRSFGLFYTIGMASGAVSPIIFGVVSDLAGVSMALAIIGISALLTVPLCLVLRRSMGAGR